MYNYLFLKTKKIRDIQRNQGENAAFRLSNAPTKHENTNHIFKVTGNNLNMQQLFSQTDLFNGQITIPFFELHFFLHLRLRFRNQYLFKTAR